MSLTRVVCATVGVALSLTSAGCSVERPKSHPAVEKAAPALTSVEPAQVAEVERINVPVSGAEPHKGPVDAPVTMVIFSDFECPFCSRVQPTLSELEQTYGPRLRLVWRHLPLEFHAHAQLAAEATQEAFAQGQDEKFWAMHDKLFANQGALTPKDLEGYAKELGLDVARFRSALKRRTHQASVQADAALAARLGARATPVFFINGRPLQGAVPVLAFKSLINDELTRVNALLLAGSPKESLYTSLVENGKPSAAFEVARPRPSPFDATVYNVPVSDADPQRGPRTALVTVVVFGDFECEYTETALQTLAPVEKKYRTDLRLVWKNRPMKLHEHAEPASTLAMLAFDKGGSNLFWQASELLFQNRTALGRKELENYGEQLGLELKDIRSALDGDAYREKIDADKELSGRIAFGVTTPMFAINGRSFKGAQSREIFELLINEELAKARARVANGVPRERIYEETVKEGKLAPFEVAPGTFSADAKKVHEISVPADAPRRGAGDAKVVIQQFADFECPFCKTVEPTLRELLEQNKDSLQLVWRNYPLSAHTHAQLAAEAAQEALAQGGNDKFWAYHDLLYANQGALTRPDLERYAQSLDLNMPKFRDALDKRRHRAVVNADLAAVDAIGEQVGTPAFLVNGLLIAGAQPIEVFKVAVQRAVLRRAISQRGTDKPAP